jgi:hypothetical protein
VRGAALLVAGVIALGGCAGDERKTTESRVPVVVPGPANTWSAVTVTGPSGAVEVPADARQPLAPLRAARALEQPGPVTEYGLDRPRAGLSYKPASTTTPPAEVDIGNANFDRHFVYVQRRGQPTVYLVPADTLRDALALVGIADKPPTD